MNMFFNYKSKQNLIGLILLSIVFLFDFLVYEQTINRILLNSGFFAAALGGAFCLYFECFWKERCQLNYYMLGFFYVLIFFITILYLELFWFILIAWTLGAVHFVWAFLLESRNLVRLMNGCVYLFPPLFVVLSNYFLVLSGPSHPLVQDEFLMAIDGSLGFYPSLVLVSLFRKLPQSIGNIFIGFYLALPTALFLIYIRRLSLEKKPPFLFIIEFLIIGVSGFILYNLVPACGAAIAFSTWPDSLPAQFSATNPQWIYCPTVAPRNSLPSLHTAWIICLLRQAWLCDKITKGLASLLAVGTVVTMFITGHYLIDLVVGFSFANCIAGLFALQLKWQNPARWQAAFFGALVTVLWYLIIFNGIPFLQLSKVLAWFLFSGSVLLSIYLELNLFKGLTGISPIYANRRVRNTQPIARDLL